jgi:hypothetical protein
VQAEPLEQRKDFSVIPFQKKVVISSPLSVNKVNFHQIFCFFLDTRVHHGFAVCLLASYNEENTRFLEASSSYLSSKGAIR